MNHRDNFRVFLSNPLVEPDSSSAERCIRSVAVFERGVRLQTVDRVHGLALRLLYVG